MAKKGKRGASLGVRLREAGAYQSARRPKLVGAARSEPPPVPRPPDGFGNAAEDGLRMLAALETLPSLEPDFGDDLADEATVTIIDRRSDPVAAPAAAPARAARTPARSLRSRLEDVGGAPAVGADETAGFPVIAEEAAVEIVDVPESGGRCSAFERTGVRPTLQAVNSFQRPSRAPLRQPIALTPMSIILDSKRAAVAIQEPPIPFHEERARCRLPR